MCVMLTIMYNNLCKLLLGVKLDIYVLLKGSEYYQIKSSKWTNKVQLLPKSYAIKNRSTIKF